CQDCELPAWASRAATATFSTPPAGGPPVKGSAGACPTASAHLGRSPRPNPRRAVLMLGMGWFPASLGGLDRYYRDLFEQLPEARGVLLGPAEDAPASVVAVSSQDTM